MNLEKRNLESNLTGVDVARLHLELQILKETNRGGGDIAPDELAAGRFGPSTAPAVRAMLKG